MRRDALELDRFYRTRKGALTRRMVLRRLGALWPEGRGLDFLGLGYATPYLKRYRAKARRAVDFMPAAQGAVATLDGVSSVVMGEETRLPFPEALFDRLLIVHGLEESEAPGPLLREAWRVLAPQGRIVIVAANRAGLWARADGTPFGHGRPFSKGQLSQLLDDALFVPTAWSRALYAPPLRWCCGPRAGAMWEKAGEHAWPGFGGVILVEAVKRVGAITPGAKRARILRPALEGAARPALSPAAKRDRGAPRAASPRKDG